MLTAAQRTRIALGTGIILGVLMLIIVGYAVYRNANRFIRTADEVSRINRVLTMIKDLDLTLTRAESEYRGFLFTNDPKYLSSFDSVSAEMDRQFKLLRIVEDQRPQNLRAIDEAESISSQKIQDMRGTLMLREQFGIKAALLDYSEKQGMSLMRQFRKALKRVDDRERAELVKEDHANRVNRDEARQYLLFGIGFSILAVFGSMMVMVRDTERRMRAEARLQAALTLQTAIFDAANAAIFAFSPRGRISLFNLTAERWLGYRGDEVLGKMTPASFHDGTELSNVASSRGPKSDLIGAITSVAREKEREERNWTLVRKDGSKFPAVVSYSVLRDEDGKAVGFVGVATDLTEIEQARRDLDVYVSELEETRGILAANNQALERATVELKESRDTAINASHLKSEFLANMSHEIRTPMNGVLGMAHLLLQTALNARQRGFVRTIQRSAEGLLTVLNDILDLSKMEAGKMALDLTPFDLRTVLEDVCENVAPAAHEKGVELTCDIPPEMMVDVIGDSGRLRQVLTNLLSNAAKFTAQGEINLVATELRRDGPLVWYRFDVKDSGIGIPLDRQEKIFESFTQADGATTRRYGGSGLGLTISRQLTDLMGGSIHLTSALGVGSTFTVDLPLKLNEIPSEQPPLASYTGKQILLIESNATLRDTLIRYITSWGAEVQSFESVSAGLTHLNSTDKIEAILLDSRSAEGNPSDLARDLQQAIPNHPPVVLLTLVMPTVREEAFSSSLKYLPKPIRYRDLNETLHRLMNGLEEVPEENVEESSAGFSGLKVLVVEDNLVNQLVATEMLHGWGCHPITAENGAIAFDAYLSNEDLDIVLMDVFMPVMDGLETTRAIRQHEATISKHIPIIAMTANAMSGDRERCLDAGMDDYLAKPLKPQDLLAAMRRFVTRSGEVDRSEVVAPSEPSLDEERLNESSGHKPTLRKKIVERYLASSVKQRDAIIAAADAQDLTALVAASHALKGSSLTISATKVSELCSTIETSARNGTVDTESVFCLRSSLETLHVLLQPFLTATETQPI